VTALLPTEEDLRGRILLPYLKSLGIDSQNIRLERSFNLRLGRTVVKIDDATSRSSLVGRADVLITNADGENLFIVEAKAYDVELSDDDADQAISYARLLDQIAPVTVVTNGRETWLFDSITKRRLETTELRDARERARGLGDADDIRLRADAMAAFLGRSTANVRAFSQSQIDRALQTLRGSTQDRHKKYLPEVYLSRPAICDAIDRFATDERCALAIIGDSGAGKTNEMCATAERLAEEHVVFFFAGRELDRSIDESLADELNWHFSEQQSPVITIRRLVDIARATRASVLLIVDALDEVEVPQFVQSTSQFAKRLSQYGGAVKLIASAKTEEWQSFRMQRGDPTSLAVELNDIDDVPPASRSVVRLSSFSPAEVDAVAPLYTKFFKVRSEPTGLLRQYCESPFLLRVASEVFEDRAYPSDAGEESLLREWLDRKLTATSDPRAAAASLLAIGRTLADYTSELQAEDLTLAERERVPLDVLLETGAVRVSDIGELVAHGLLSRHVDRAGRPSLAFYFSRIRDYYIARHVLRLDERSAPELERRIPDFLRSLVLEGALFWHIAHSNSEHRRAFANVVEARAIAFLAAYEGILGRLGMSMRDRFEPNTELGIGLAISVNDRGGVSWGLYPQSDSHSAKLTRISLAGDSEWKAFHGAFSRLRVRTIRSGGSQFLSRSPQAVAAEHVSAQLGEILQQGALDESCSPVLIAEGIRALATRFHKELRLGQAGRPLHRFQVIETTDANDLRIRLHTYFGERMLWNEWVDEQHRRQTKWVKNIGVRSFSVATDPEALADIRARAADLASQGRRFPAPHILGEQEELETFAVLIDVAVKNRVRLDLGMLPPPDRAPKYFNGSLSLAYSDGAIRTLLETVFVEAVDAYQHLVECCFPADRNLFSLYSKLPVTIVAAYYPPRDASVRDDAGSLNYTMLAGGHKNRAQIHIAPQYEVFRIRNAPYMALVDQAFQPMSDVLMTGVLSILSPYDAPGFRSKNSSAGRRCPIRALAYRLIRNDVRKISLSA